MKWKPQQEKYKWATVYKIYTGTLTQKKTHNFRFYNTFKKLLNYPMEFILYDTSTQEKSTD